MFLVEPTVFAAKLLELFAKPEFRVVFHHHFAIFCRGFEATMTTWRLPETASAARMWSFRRSWRFLLGSRPSPGSAITAKEKAWIDMEDLHGFTGIYQQANRSLRLCVYCICTYIHTYMHAYIHTYIHTHTHIYIYIWLLSSFSCQRLANHTHTHINAYFILFIYV